MCCPQADVQADGCHWQGLILDFHLQSESHQLLWKDHVPPPALRTLSPPRDPPPALKPQDAASSPYLALVSRLQQSLRPPHLLQLDLPGDELLGLVGQLPASRQLWEPADILHVPAPRRGKQRNSIHTENKSILKINKDFTNCSPTQGNPPDSPP